MKDQDIIDKEIFDKSIAIASNIVSILFVVIIVIAAGVVNLYTYFNPSLSMRAKKELKEEISKEYGAMVEDIFKVGRGNHIRIAVKDSLFYLDRYDDRLLCIAEIGDSIYKLANENMCVIVNHKTQKKYLVPYSNHPQVKEAYKFELNGKLPKKYPGIEMIKISEEDAHTILRNRKIKELYSVPSLSPF